MKSLKQLLIFSAIGFLLSGCFIGERIEGLVGPSGVLSICRTSKGSFETSTACKILSAANATKYVTGFESYITILLPQEDVLNNYLVGKHMTVDEFINSDKLQPFVNQHVIYGNVANATSLKNLNGATVQFSISTNGYVISDYQAATLIDMVTVHFVKLNGIIQ